MSLTERKNEIALLPVERGLRFCTFSADGSKPFEVSQEKYYDSIWITAYSHIKNEIIAAITKNDKFIGIIDREK